jgi:hypothetical protein
MHNEYPISGYSQNFVGCASLNTGLVQTAIDQNIKAIVCGHDHNNDFYGTYFSKNKQSI